MSDTPLIATFITMPLRHYAMLRCITPHYHYAIARQRHAITPPQARHAVTSHAIDYCRRHWPLANMPRHTAILPPQAASDTPRARHTPPLRYTEIRHGYDTFILRLLLLFTPYTLCHIRYATMLPLYELLSLLLPLEYMLPLSAAADATLLSPSCLRC